jgi:hypothetical protein
MVTGYGDPTKETLSNGRSMAELMRGGSRGLSGVIVAPATAGGVPANFDPSGYRRTPIHIDPDNPDGPVLTLDDMTEDRVQRALKIAQTAVPGSDIHAVRERAMLTMRELAKMADEPPPQSLPPAAARPTTAPSVPATAEDAVVPIGTQIPAPPSYEQVDRNYSPMAAFGLRPPDYPAARPVGPPPASLQANVKIGPPQRLVYFEKEGIGTVPAFFHEVLVSVTRQDPENPIQSGFMVLIYDLRFEQNAARWFPPADDPYGRPWAIHIKSDRRLYLVHTTGFQYVYDSREYCVLMVERAVAAPTMDDTE